MSDLIERLRKDGNSSGAYVPSYSQGPILTIEAADRIEALEAALRAIADPDNCLMIPEIEEIARAALAPEQDK
jgi:hypothetical protein